MSKAVPRTRSIWFHLARSQSRLDQEITRLAAPDLAHENRSSCIVVQVQVQGSPVPGTDVEDVLTLLQQQHREEVGGLVQAVGGAGADRVCRAFTFHGHCTLCCCSGIPV